MNPPTTPLTMSQLSVAPIGMYSLNTMQIQERMMVTQYQYAFPLVEIEDL